MIEAILTIDDIASENTHAIVDYLCEQNIPAVMFAVGQNIEKFYENAVYAVKKGMIVGNHSYSHPAFSAITLERAAEEILKTEALLDKIYKEAEVKRIYRLFRFPYGDKGGKNRNALQAFLRENKFSKLKDCQISYDWYTKNELHNDIDTFWTFDFGEWQIRPEADFSANDVIHKMDEPHPIAGAPLFAENSQHILLLHAHDETEVLVPKYYKLFLEYAMKKGVQFKAPEF